uniref:Uncharacterized protein n=1 Tax=Anas platyrhynchos platyrhynchos TaxID=8840 RepID=A0A493SXA6_ANAPP
FSTRKRPSLGKCAHNRAFCLLKTLVARGLPFAILEQTPPPCPRERCACPSPTPSCRVPARVCTHSLPCLPGSPQLDIFSPQLVPFLLHSKDKVANCFQ